MSHHPPAFLATRSVSAATFLVIAVLMSALVGCSQSGRQPDSSVSIAEPPTQDSFERRPAGVPGEVPDQFRGRSALGVADGEIPDGVTVFDDDYPAVTELDPALLGALRQAATAARGDGVEFIVNSGWRSAAFQEQLLDEAVATYGSRSEAVRWVATPATSLHVSGDAVDIGRAGAVAWLSEHGPEYGLCQIYRNEPWHYELRPDVGARGCPSIFADPTEDPRMQR